LAVDATTTASCDHRGMWFAAFAVVDARNEHPAETRSTKTNCFVMKPRYGVHTNLTRLASMKSHPDRHP
jgi:hypothetical protein